MQKLLEIMLLNKFSKPRERVISKPRETVIAVHTGMLIHLIICFTLLLEMWRFDEIKSETETNSGFSMISCFFREKG